VWYACRARRSGWVCTGPSRHSTFLLAKEPFSNEVRSTREAVTTKLGREPAFSQLQTVDASCGLPLAAAGPLGRPAAREGMPFRTGSRRAWVGQGIRSRALSRFVPVVV
jgi:hypothetical protein